MHLGCLGCASCTAIILDWSLEISFLDLAFCCSRSNFLFKFFLVDLRALGDRIYLSLRICPTSGTDKKIFSLSARNSVNWV